MKGVIVRNGISRILARVKCVLAGVSVIDLNDSDYADYSFSDKVSGVKVESGFLEAQLVALSAQLDGLEGVRPEYSLGYRDGVLDALYVISRRVKGMSGDRK